MPSVVARFKAHQVLHEPPLVMPIVMTHGFGNVGLSISLCGLLTLFLVSLFICLIKYLLTIGMLFLHRKTLPSLLITWLSHLVDYVQFAYLAGCMTIWKQYLNC